MIAVVPRHRQLVETAEDEGRVILTCDRVFVRARHSEYTYFVRSERKQEQLEEVRQRHRRSCRGCSRRSCCVLFRELRKRCCQC